MKRPTKLQLQILKKMKQESLARMRCRISKGIRAYNICGIKTNWMYQGDTK